MPKLLSLAFFFLLSGVIQAQNVLNIKIIDEENLNMPGANVQLKPGNRKAISNQSGVATFQGLNTGRYTLIIEYVGYHTSQKAIEVKAGSNTFTEQLKSGVNIMKEVMVLGDRLKGQAKALNQQKNNLNITNVISSEQVGRFPDANIGDAIRRVPGITMQNDQGEARNIIIRGMGPELNSVNLNGERIPSAEGDNRRIQMDLIPADVIQTIEVSKTLTAEMDADAIGGSVNLITRAPSNGLRISGTIAGGSAPIRNGFNGTANFIIGNRTDRKSVV